MAGYCELKKTVSGGYMFNLKAGNREVIWTSETYSTKQAGRGTTDVGANQLAAR